MKCVSFGFRTKPKCVVSAAVALVATCTIVAISTSTRDVHADELAPDARPPVVRPAEVVDPLAVNKAVERVEQRRANFEKILAEVRGKMGKLPAMDLKSENEIVETYLTKVIPALRAWRNAALQERGKISEMSTGYIDALRTAIDILQSDAAESEAMVLPGQNAGAEPLTRIQSPQVRDHLTKLAGANKTIAMTFQERAKAARIVAAECHVFLQTIDECGIFFDKWEGTLRAMREAGLRGEVLMREIAAMRALAQTVQDSFAVFLRATDKLRAETTTPGSTPEAGTSK